MAVGSGVTRNRREWRNCKEMWMQRDPLKSGMSMEEAPKQSTKSLHLNYGVSGCFSHIPFLYMFIEDKIGNESWKTSLDAMMIMVRRLLLLRGPTLRPRDSLSLRPILQPLNDSMI